MIIINKLLERLE